MFLQYRIIELNSWPRDYSARDNRKWTWILYSESQLGELHELCQGRIYESAKKAYEGMEDAVVAIRVSTGDLHPHDETNFRHISNKREEKE